MQTKRATMDTNVPERAGHESGVRSVVRGPSGKEAHDVLEEHDLERPAVCTGNGHILAKQDGMQDDIRTIREDHGALWWLAKD